GPVLQGVVHQLGDDLGLLRRHHRPDLGGPLARDSHREPLRLPDDPLEEPVGDVAVDVDALDPRAGLTGVGEAPPDRAGDGVGEVGVGADDLRVLAAQLQHRSLHALGALDANLLADLDRAGEEDLPRDGFDERVADTTAAVDRSHQALRQAGLLEQHPDALPDQRRQAGGLEHDAVAGHQRDRDLAEWDRPRIVPGGDDADDADRPQAQLPPLPFHQNPPHHLPAAHA